MESKYQENYRIPCFMFDRGEQLRPAAFMDIAQDLAVYGAEQLQFDDRNVKEQGVVWILARMTVQFDRYPKRYDSVKLQTWHRGLDGLYFIREYQMIGADGQTAVRGTSSWILMDMETRRVVRSDRMKSIVSIDPQNLERAIPESSPKIVLPAGAVMEACGERKVVYSDVDYNGHANNAKYTAWAMDCLDQDMVYTRQMRDITINFNHEAHPGSTVAFYRYQDGDTIYVEGKGDGHQVFICKMTFEDRK